MIIITNLQMKKVRCKVLNNFSVVTQLLRCMARILTKQFSSRIQFLNYYFMKKKGKQETKIKQCWWVCGKIGTLAHCWWEYKIMQVLWKTVWSFLQKLEIEIPYDPIIPLLGIYPKKQKHYLKRYMQGVPGWLSSLAPTCGPGWNPGVQGF